MDVIKMRQEMHDYIKGLRTQIDSQVMDQINSYLENAYLEGYMKGLEKARHIYNETDN